MSSSNKNIVLTDTEKKELSKLIIAQQKNELIGYHLYKHLGTLVKDENHKKILLEMSSEEQNHYVLLTKANNKPYKLSGFRIWFEKIKVTISYYLLGLTFVLKYFENQEADSNELRRIYELDPVLGAFITEEEEHEQLLIGMVDEDRLKYMGSVVLGLNDALVELTGALAGFTFSIQHTTNIAFIGLITGISAAFSMAASEFLSTDAEDSDAHPVTASIYTGLAYIFTVAVLITPFFLLPPNDAAGINHFIALGITILLSILIIALFNYYMSVAKDQSFKKKFFQMVGISLGVALISFGIGIFVKEVLGFSI
jgi:VIT1/CCC1 family predicted Fe2+/Mn2+ transporter